MSLRETIPNSHKAISIIIGLILSFVYYGGLDIPGFFDSIILYIAIPVGIVVGLIKWREMLKGGRFNKFLIFISLAWIPLLPSVYGIIDYPTFIDIIGKYIIFPVCIFTVGIKFKGMIERGEDNLFIYWIGISWMGFVLPVDVVWNAFPGSLIYRELPQWHKGEFLFTTRTKRMLYESIGRILERAIFWRDTLNDIDKGHI